MQAAENILILRRVKEKVNMSQLQAGNVLLLCDPGLRINSFTSSSNKLTSVCYPIWLTAHKKTKKFSSKWIQLTDE